MTCKNVIKHDHVFVKNVFSSAYSLLLNMLWGAVQKKYQYIALCVGVLKYAESRTYLQYGVTGVLY